MDLGSACSALNSRRTQTAAACEGSSRMFVSGVRGENKFTTVSWVFTAHMLLFAAYTHYMHSLVKTSFYKVCSDLPSPLLWVKLIQAHLLGVIHSIITPEAPGTVSAASSSPERQTFIRGRAYFKDPCVKYGLDQDLLCTDGSELWNL